MPSFPERITAPAREVTLPGIIVCHGRGLETRLSHTIWSFANSGVVRARIVSRRPISDSVVALKRFCS